MQIDYKITLRQTEALKYLISKDSVSLLFGGAKGGGKSFLLCLWVVIWVYELIKFFGIDKPKHPVPLGFIGRKRAVDFNDTTFETFKRVVPSHLYKVNTQEKEIIFFEKGVAIAKVMYGGLDDQNDINKFNSAEFAFIAIDQAEETTRQDVAVLQGAMRFTLNGKMPPYKQLYTANPSEGWLKEDFIHGNRAGTIFIPALPDDNPYLPSDYKQTLRDAFGHDPQLLKAYLEGDWDAFANVENAVFSPKWFTNCRNIKDESDADDPRIIAVDVATKHGECETVLVKRRGNTIVDIICWKGLNTVQSSLRIKTEYDRFGAEILVIDSDGFGEGIADTLMSYGVGVTEFHGGNASKAVDERRFKNLRAQFYTLTAKAIEKEIICLSLIDSGLYERLKTQSCSIMYKFPDGQARVQIESKEDMNTRGIKSPDLADGLVYSQYGLWMAKFADMGPMKMGAL